MSLIALTERLDTGRNAARMLLLLIAITGAVIVGLLAMHSLNSHTADHAGSLTSAEHSDLVATSTLDQNAAADGCGDCGSHTPSMLLITCGLAILVALLIFTRPFWTRAVLATLPRPHPSPSLALQRPALPPSLSALCISRT